MQMLTFLSFLLISHSVHNLMFDNLEMQSTFPPSVFTLPLNPLFVFHIDWLRSLFPLLSMHEADSAGEPRDP